MVEYKSDPILDLHQVLDDQDTFLIKIPHKMRNILKSSNESDDTIRWMEFTGTITASKR